MTSVLQPGPGRYTVEDWESVEHRPDGPRVELIGGEFSVVPPPSVHHQYFGDELRLVLREALCAAGREDLYAVTAIGVKIATPHGFIPDIAVISVPPWGATLTAEQVLLAVEIVSPSTRRNDRLVKPAAYAAAGVAFYWRVEPADDAAPTIVCSVLCDGRYVEDTVLRPGTTTTVIAAAPVPVTLDPAELLPHRR